MAKLKTYRLTPNQIEALATLAGRFPETFSVAIENGRPQHFEFPITELDTVHLYTMRAGNRTVDLGLYDLSDEVIEFDQEYCTSADAWKINRAEIEFRPGAVSIINDVKIPYDECLEIVNKAGYPSENVEDLIWVIEDLPEVKWILLAAFLINNPIYLAKDEVPQLDVYRGKVAELDVFETAKAA